MTAPRRIPLVLRRLFGPVVVLGLVAGAVALAKRLGLPLTASVVDPATNVPFERNYGVLAVGVASAFLLARLLDYILFDLILRRRGKPAPPALLRQLVSLVVFVAGVSIVCKLVLSMRLTALLTTSAIITAVVGLALQDTLGNFFAGLALHMERTVGVGDVLRTGETFGVVEELSWRAIKVRTMDGNLLLVPNSVAGRERLEVFPRPGPPIVRTLRVGLEYDASPGQVRDALEPALRGIAGVAAFPSPAVFLKSFDDYAVRYELRYALEDYARFVEVDSAVRERVWYAAERAGLKMAYPVIRQHQFAAGPLERRTHDADVLAALDAAELFAPLSPDERRRLAAGARERRFGPDEVIVREGDDGSSMFFVRTGRVAVSVHGGKGESRKLTLLDPGAAFGEISLLTGDPRTATVRAATEATLVEIHKDTLAPILRGHPALVELLEHRMRERRRGAAEALEAARAESTAAQTPLPLGARIARFFGLGDG